MGTFSMNDPKQVVVFGASGFIGNSIYRYLQRLKSFDVVGYSSVDCNLLDRRRVAQVLDTCGPETSVVFCSAITRSVEDSWDAMLKNITMVHNFTSSIPNSGLRSIIFMSSVDVYGMPPETSPICEDTKLRPDGYYGLSKLVCEELLRFEPTCKCAVSILRLPGIYGAGDGFQSIVGKFIKQILHHENIQILGDGTAKRDYVEIGDLCQVVEHFLRRPFSGVVNVATGRSIAIKTLIRIIATVVDIEPTVQFLPHANTHTRGGDLVFDTAKLESLCANLQFKNLEQGVMEYVSDLLA